VLKSAELKSYLVSELRSVGAYLIANYEQSPSYAVYFFSAAYGAVQRVLNIEYNTELVLLHNVLSTAHGQMAAAQQQGRITFDILNRLGISIALLADRIESDAPLIDLFLEISELSYSTTGNGFYLRQIGRIPNLSAVQTIAPPPNLAS